MKITQKILNKVIAPVTERLLNATYGVYSSKVDTPLDYEEWCKEVKNVLQYDTCAVDDAVADCTDV